MEALGGVLSTLKASGWRKGDENGPKWRGWVDATACF